LVDQIRRADLQIVLLRVPTAGDVHTLMAVLLDPSAFSGASMVNFGSGAHLSPTVAAIRAITEAAQARLTFIHGSRDDLTERAYVRGANHEALLSYFTALRPDTPWSALADRASESLAADRASVLSTIPCAYAVDLGQGLAGVSAMKVIVPGARLADWI
jgi:ribosomal protein S12 methylthiotransferase accessory factor